MLTVGQAALELHVTPQRVRQLCAAGRLVAAKHGRDWAIEPASVAAYDATGRQPPGRRARNR